MMLHFANAHEFQSALSTVIHAAREPHPSRYLLAARLEGLATKLAAPRRKKKKEPTPLGRQVLVNIAEKERSSLDYLGSQLEFAVWDIDKELKHILVAISRLEDDAAQDDRKLESKETGAAYNPGGFFAGQILDFIEKGLDYLSGTLKDNAELTEEHDLAAAVKKFLTSLPKEGDWPDGKGEKHFHDVQKALSKAREALPTALTKRSELTKLRQAFDAIADVVKLITGKSVSVPRLPNDLDPEDPRQLGFGFAASGRVANATDLVRRLTVIEHMASRPHPSRGTLASAILAVARDLRHD